jgi:hypothetical protein
LNHSQFSGAKTLVSGVTGSLELKAENDDDLEAEALSEIDSLLSGQVSL